MPKTYTSDLLDSEWNLIAKFFEPDPKKKRKRGRINYVNEPRDIVDAIFYRLKTGCQWRNLPSDFPKWESVATHYYKWVKNGLWKKVSRSLSRIYRVSQGKKPNPTYAIMDSQSVKTGCGAKKIGYDGGKKVKGRKRQVSVDILGLVLTVLISAANISDTHLGARTLGQISHELPSVFVVSADEGYKEVSSKAAEEHGIELHVAKRIDDGFKVLPKRWIVERTFSWFGNFRILSKDFCVKTRCAAAEIWAASVCIILNKFKIMHTSII